MLVAIFCSLLLSSLCASGPTYERTEKFDDDLNFNVRAIYCGGNPDTDPWDYNPDKLVTSRIPKAGVFCSNSTPGSRMNQASLLYEDQHKLYVFGGFGYDATAYIDFMNDVWSYDYFTKQWAFHFGTTFHQEPWVVDEYHGVSIYPESGNLVDPGVFSKINRPGGREGSVMMHGLTDEHFLIFGGYGYFHMRSRLLTSNQVWQYNLTHDEWTYMAGMTPPYLWSGSEAFTSITYFISGGYNDGMQLKFPSVGKAPGSRSESVLFEPLEDSDPNIRIIFGGFMDERRGWNDVWALHLDRLGDESYIDENSGGYELAWEELYPDSGDPSLPCRVAKIADLGNFHVDNRPAPRAGAYAWSYKLKIDLELRIFFFGGFDNCNGEILNDVWRFNYKMKTFLPILAGRGGDEEYRQKAGYYFHPGVYRPENCSSLSGSEKDLCVEEDGAYEMESYPGSRAYGNAFFFQREGEQFKETYVFLMFGLGMASDGPGFIGDSWILDLQEKKWAYYSTVNLVNDFGDYQSLENRPSSRFNALSFTALDEGGNRAYYILNGLSYRDFIVDATQDIWNVNFTYSCYGHQIWEPEVCGGHGFCESQDQCDCSYQYLGDKCDEVKNRCGGLYYDSDDVCSGKGWCSSVIPGYCHCREEYFGDLCTDKIPTSGHEFGEKRDFTVVEFFDFINTTIDGQNVTIPTRNSTYEDVTFDILRMRVQVYPMETTKYRGIDTFYLNGESDCKYVLAEETIEMLGTGMELSEDEESGFGPFCVWGQQSPLAISSGYYDELYILLGRGHRIRDNNKVIKFGDYYSVVGAEKKCANLKMWKFEGYYSNEYCWFYYFNATAEGTLSGFTTIVPAIEVPPEEGTSYTWILLVILFGILLILCCLCCLCICICCCVCDCCMYGWWKAKQRLDKLRRLRHLNIIRLEKEKEVGSIETVEMDQELFDIDETDLDIRDVISSSGSTAVVYKAKFKGETVAFKSFKTGQISTQDSYDDFENEVKLLARLHHVNLLEFYGCFMKPPRVGIVTEFCHCGDLRNYLSGEKAQNPSLELHHRLRILKEVADVMSFLNEENIVHRDLKADNILLTKKLTAKLIDFGLSRVVEGAATMYMTRQAGTSQYMAPEVTLSSSYTDKCDVFSFSILIFELLTNDFFPYGDQIEFNLELRVALNPDFRPPIEKKPIYGVKSLAWLFQLMKRGWNVDVSYRPDFDEVRHIFDEHIEETVANLEEVEKFFWEERDFEFLMKQLPENEIRNFLDEEEVKEVEGEEDLEIDDADIDGVMDDIFDD